MTPVIFLFIWKCLPNGNRIGKLPSRRQLYKENIERNFQLFFLDIQPFYGDMGNTLVTIFLQGSTLGYCLWRHFYYVKKCCRTRLSLHMNSFPASRGLFSLYSACGRKETSAMGRIVLWAQHRPIRPMAEVSFLPHAEYKEKRPLLAGKLTLTYRLKAAFFFPVTFENVEIHGFIIIFFPFFSSFPIWSATWTLFKTKWSDLLVVLISKACLPQLLFYSVLFLILRLVVQENLVKMEEVAWQIMKKITTSACVSQVTKELIVKKVSFK